MDKAEAIIFIGGTFDPIHKGHTLLAEALYNLFHQPVTFVPAAPPNYKMAPQTTAMQRLDMLKLALANNQHYLIDNSEIFLSEYRPTVTSLKQLRKKIGNQTPVYFLIGEDSLVSLDSWDNWQELFNLTNFIVAMRPGYELSQMSEKLANEYNNRLVTNIQSFNQPSGQIYILDFKPLDISSTQIRHNIHNDLPFEEWVDARVAQYIIKNKLYLPNKL